MRSADLLFLPMHDLPPGARAGLIPYKTYEYLAAGRPILAAVPDGDVRDMLARSRTSRWYAPATSRRWPRRCAPASPRRAGAASATSAGAEYARHRSVERIAECPRSACWRDRAAVTFANRVSAERGRVDEGRSRRCGTSATSAGSRPRHGNVTSGSRRRASRGGAGSAWPVLKPVLRAFGWQRAWGDDWNHWWAEHFDDYRFLPEHLGDYIELGCGPYTNTRLILPGRTADARRLQRPAGRDVHDVPGPLARHGPPRRAGSRSTPTRSRSSRSSPGASTSSS